MDKYQNLKQIGKGSFGLVYSSLRIIDNLPVIIKYIDKRKLITEKLINRANREIRIAHKLKGHPNILNMINFGESDNYIYMVSEFTNDTGLSFSTYPINLKEDYYIGLFVLLQIADAIKYMHTLNIIHRDIKPTNIVIKFDGIYPIPVIIDFDLSCILNHEKYGCFSGKLGTPNYMSPEMLFAKKTDTMDYFKNDIYALGGTFYYILNNKKFPHGNLSDIEEIQDYVSKYKLRPSNSGILEIDMLIMSMLDKNPKLRPSADEVLDELLLIERD